MKVASASDSVGRKEDPLIPFGQWQLGSMYRIHCKTKLLTDSLLDRSLPSTRLEHHTTIVTVQNRILPSVCGQRH